MKPDLQLTAYVDESGTHGAKSPRTILGGFVATNDQWRDFNVRWAKLLKEYGVSEVHGVELRNRKGDFKGWSQEKHHQFVLAINELTQRRTKFSFWIELDNADYEMHYVAGYRPREKPLDTKYGLCFRQMLSWLTLRLDQLFPGRSVTVRLILEDGAKNAGDAQRIFDEFQKHADPHQVQRVSGFSFTSLNRPGTQVADLVAYMARRIERPNMDASEFTGSTLTEARAASPNASRSPVFRLPCIPEHLRELKQNVLDQIAEKKADQARTHMPRRSASGHGPSGSGI